MQIHIKATNLELTDALKEYADAKVGGLATYLSRWEKEGEVETWVEVARTTNHHKKGDVFSAVIDVRLPGKTLRASETEWDVRIAIDRAHDTLQREITKYKEILSENR